MKSARKLRAGTLNTRSLMTARQARTLLTQYVERFPAMKQVIAAGKAGPLFTPDPDAIPPAVEAAFEQVAPTMDRNEHARMALLCLSEAASAFGHQPKAVELIRRIMIDNGIFTPEPAEK